jgi:hypothetical protein
MFEEEGMEVIYLNFNDHINSSVYIFAVASKNKERWRGVIDFHFREKDRSKIHLNEPYIGCNAIQNHVYRLKRFIGNALRGGEEHG